MIPKNIKRHHILKAIEFIDKNGIPKPRLSRTYNLKYDGKLYPPKYLISVANSIANGTELEPFLFGGGEETNTFLENLGFEIVSSEKKEALSSQIYDNDIKVVTVVVENRVGEHPENDERFSFMKTIIGENSQSDVILFPAGFFYLNHQKESSVNKLCNQICEVLNSLDCFSTICFGIDCDSGRDQLAVAVNGNGIQAMGRKFYPTSDESGYIREANTYNDYEMGYSRIFKVKGKSIFLAVCYDGFGIRHRQLPDLGIDIVLVLAHQFWSRGEGASGDVDFARKGFAGASQHWRCPVFGTAVFFCRDIPQNWPTGVLWKDQSKSVRFFKYNENEITWRERKKVIGNFECALCYKYIVFF